MKIVHVVENLAVGGLERVVLSLAAWQRRRGDTSQVICLFDEGALAAEARQQGLEVVALGKRRGLDLKALTGLRHALRTSRADVLHTHNPVAHYHAAAASLGLGIAHLINTRHGMGSVSTSSRLDRLYRVALLGTDAAVSVCHAGRDHYVRCDIIPAHKAVVVPNGVAVADIQVHDAQARTRLLAQLGRPASSTILGSVGRLNPVKDYATLLQAMHLLRSVGRAVDLVIAGDGESRSSLEALRQTLQLQDCVHFLGMRKDVAQILSAFDIFVSSSTSEGYSLALVEAAAAALPIVATRVGGNADIVANGINGLLVEAQDPQALAQALTRLVDDVDLREHMGQAGRQWALQHGTVEAMGQAYLALYEASPVGTGQPRTIPGRATTPGPDA